MLLNLPKPKIGKYERIKFIGKGAFGDVWLVRDKVTKKEYAAKIIRTDEENEEKIATEIKLLKNLKNPSVVEYIEDFKDRIDGTTATVILTEYCSGTLVSMTIPIK